jgi:hypothetical protein
MHTLSSAQDCLTLLPDERKHIHYTNCPHTQGIYIVLDLTNQAAGNCCPRQARSPRAISNPTQHSLACLSRRTAFCGHNNTPAGAGHAIPSMPQHNVEAAGCPAQAVTNPWKRTIK